MIKTKTTTIIKEYDTYGNVKKKTKEKTVTKDDADYREFNNDYADDLPFSDVR